MEQHKTAFTIGGDFGEKLQEALTKTAFNSRKTHQLSQVVLTSRLSERHHRRLSSALDSASQRVIVGGFKGKVVRSLLTHAEVILVDLFLTLSCCATQR